MKDRNVVYLDYEDVISINQMIKEAGKNKIIRLVQTLVGEDLVLSIEYFQPSPVKTVDKRIKN